MIYRLRPLEEKDAARMTEMMHDAVTIRYLQIGGADYTEDTALRFIRSTVDESVNLHRAVVNLNDEYQGTISLKNIDLEKKEAEYAISMHPDAQGKGAAKAATAEILNIAFNELHLNRVYLNVLAENLRANKFYKKVGFSYSHTTQMNFHQEVKSLNWYFIEYNYFDI